MNSMIISIVKTQWWFVFSTLPRKLNCPTQRMSMVNALKEIERSIDRDSEKERVTKLKDHLSQPIIKSFNDQIRIISKI